MAMAFTDWDKDLKCLTHSGIKGMKWGVRRYQNRDGSLTALGKERYGDSSGKHVSARKIQRDLNRLDQSYANAVGLRERAGYKANKNMSKMITGNHGPKKNSRLLKKSQKASEDFRKHNRDVESIENMQMQILKKASKSGYRVSSRKIERMANSGRRTAIGLLGGPMGLMNYDSIANANGYGLISGKKFKVKDKSRR